MTDEQELELLRWMIQKNLQLKQIIHFNKTFYSVIQGDYVIAIKPTYIEALHDACHHFAVTEKTVMYVPNTVGDLKPEDRDPGDIW